MILPLNISSLLPFIFWHIQEDILGWVTICKWTKINQQIFIKNVLCSQDWTTCWKLKREHVISGPNNYAFCDCKTNIQA